MINYLQMSKLYEFVDAIEDSETKTLLNDALFDLNQYYVCGTVEECKKRKNWMNCSMNDILEIYFGMLRECKDELEAKEKEVEYYKNQVPKKRKKTV